MEKASKSDRKKQQVWTPPHITNQMLDMLDQACFSDENICFLEPSCGDGQMLIVIIERIYAALMQKYDGEEGGKEKALVNTCWKFYAIDIDPDMVVKCRMRMFKFFMEKARSCDQDLLIQYLIGRQMRSKIECKDFLKMNASGESISNKIRRWWRTIKIKGGAPCNTEN